jgi:hypothetical protein
MRLYILFSILLLVGCLNTTNRNPMERRPVKSVAIVNSSSVVAAVKSSTPPLRAKCADCKGTGWLMDDSDYVCPCPEGQKVRELFLNPDSVY